MFYKIYPRKELKLEVTCSDNIENLSIEAAEASPDDPTKIQKLEDRSTIEVATPVRQFLGT